MSAPRVVVTERHLTVLKAALGLDRANKPYRNAYVTAPGTEAHALLEELCSVAMAVRTDLPRPDGLLTYRATERGEAMAVCATGVPVEAVDGDAGEGVDVGAVEVVSDPVPPLDVLATLQLVRVRGRLAVHNAANGGLLYLD